MNNLLVVKENDEHVLGLALHCLAFFGLGEFGFSVYGSCFLPERFPNHYQGLRCTFSEICTKFNAHSPFLRRARREISSG
jgi:hypothetical protein